MPREYFLLLSSFLISPALTTPNHALAAAAHAPQIIAADQTGALTLGDAKALVARSLLESGQRMVRVGHAEFDGNGNVVVELVTQEGIPFRHVLVDGKTHELLAAKNRHTLNG
jgi:hypothetical protein